MVHAYRIVSNVHPQNGRYSPIACWASFDVSNTTVPDPLGRPSAPILMSARIIFPAARNKSLRSCHPAWYGSYDIMVGLSTGIEVQYARFRHKAGSPGCWPTQSNCAKEGVVEGRHVGPAQPLPYQSYRERASHQTELHFHDPNNDDVYISNSHRIRASN